jgi:protein-disulfide isomerase
MSIPESHGQVPARKRGAAFLTGLGLLAVAAAASGILVAHRLGGLAIPGCGGGGPCERAANSPWGTIPLLDWPLSHAGAAWFGGLLVSWLLTRGELPPALRWLVRAGAAVSLFLTCILLVEDLLCPYCLATHVANVLFAALVELGPRTDVRPRARALASAVIGCAAISTVLALAESGMRARNERELAGSIREIQERATRSGGPEKATGLDSVAPAAGEPNPLGFTGRYRLGPERAPIRIVMITDYACPDCRNFEAQAMEILARRPDVSLSIKHFPFCADCNPTPGVRNLHPNSCWAARAAEAAGLLHGDAAFWKMHRWLFEHRGAFTETELDAGLRDLGFERDPFLAALRSPETLRRVQADIREAAGLGLQATPMMFVNGVELRGWNADALALRRAVEAVAAAGPLSRGPEEDRPPSAAERNRQEAERILSDWRRAPAMALPGREQPWTSASENASVRVTLFGDLLERGTAAADRVIRDAAAARGDVRYEFRYFPLDQSCNPTLPRTTFPLGCSAARAAEAAGEVGGIDAYWRTHIWITEHQREFSVEALRTAAPSLGLDPAGLLAKMNSPEVARVVAEDARTGQRIGIPEIPRVFVNGRPLGRWSLPEQPILARVLEEASSQK